MNQQVVCIESNTPEREVLHTFLMRKYSCVFFPQVKDVLPQLNTLEPALILYDMELAPPNEFVALKKSIGEKFTYEIPIVVMVSENSLEKERFARELQVFYYLIKPFELQELDEVIYHALKFSHAKKLEAQIFAIRKTYDGSLVCHTT